MLDLSRHPERSVSEAPDADPAPRPAPWAARPRLAWIDRVGFLTCAAVIVPYAIWVFVLEREMFSRLPVVLVTVLLAAALQVYYAGARSWILGRKPRRVRLRLIAMLLVLGPMSFIVVPSILLVIAACEIVHRFTPMRRGLRRTARRDVQLGMTAAVVLVLFPAMNALYGISGALVTLSPVQLMHNPFYGINADGYRGPRLQQRKEPGTVRLLFLGDSITFGWPYRYDDVYPEIVRRLLVERGLGPVEIIDAGAPGQSVLQIRNKLEHQLEYAPDAVFLMDGKHFEKTLEQSITARHYTGRYDDHAFRVRFRPPILTEIVVLGAAANPIPPVRFVAQVIGHAMSAAMSAHPAVEHPGPPEDPRTANARIAAGALASLVDMVHARGLPLFILEYPSEKVPADVRRHQKQAALRDGVVLVPLLYRFPDADHYSFRDGIHPDKAGHRLIAEVIVQELVARGWPPRVAPRDGAAARKGSRLREGRAMFRASGPP